MYRNVKFSELENLLHKENKLQLYQEKWYKDLSNSNINIKEELYSLMVTGNKRRLIYNKDNYLVDTKPFLIDEI